MKRQTRVNNENGNVNALVNAILNSNFTKLNFYELFKF